MLKNIITYLNLKLDLLNYFDLTRCLSELKGDNEGKIYPVEYISEGNYERIDFDNFDGVSYWRLRDEITSDRLTNIYKAGKRIEVTVPLRLVFSVRRSKLTTDDAYAFDRIRQTIVKQFNIDDGTLKSSLLAEKVIITSPSANGDSKEVWDSETDNTGTFEPRLDFVYGSVDIDVVVTYKGDCMPTECDDVDSDILHTFNFCLPSVRERLTNAQITCLTDSLCGTPDPVTEQVNGVTIGTAASGTTNNQVIENSEGTPIGTAANPSIVPDARVGANGNYLAQVAATVDSTIDVHDSSGADVGSQNGVEWQISDSVININGVDEDSVKAEQTFNLLVKLNGVETGVYDEPTKTVNVSAASPSLEIGCFSDAGFTTPITDADWDSTVYIRATATGFTPTTYNFYVYRGSHYKQIVRQSSNSYAWSANVVGDYTIVVEGDDGSTFAFDEFDFTVNEIALANDASSIARWTFEDDSYLTFNGSTISQITDANGNGKTLAQASAGLQPSIQSYTSPTGLQFARFLSSQLQNTFTSPVDYPDITFVLVMGCDGNSNTTRVGRITKTGQNDFNGANSIAMQETRMEKSGATAGGGKYPRDLIVLIYRIESGVTTHSDFFSSQRKITSTSGVPTGGITFENVFMGMQNANGLNVGEWHFIGRKLSDAEVVDYGNYMVDKWIG